MSSFDLAEWWERIRQLKRDGNLSRAIDLLEQGARDQEAEHRREGYGVAPGMFLELQKLYRREGRYLDEVAILQRLKAGSTHPDASVDAMIDDARQRMEAASAGPVPSACPHCGVVFDPPPKASRRCPECREKLVIRTDPITRVKLVLSPDGAEDFDRQKEASATKRRIMKRISSLRLSGEDYEAAAADLREQFNVAEPLPGDVFWRLASNLHMVQERSGEWSDAARTFSEMAKYLRDEGRDPTICLEQKFINVLRDHAEATAPGSASIAIPFVDIAAHSGCEVCGADDGRRLSIADAQEQMPLPHDNCPEGYCGCVYWTVRPSSAYESEEDITVAPIAVAVHPAPSEQGKMSRVKRLFGR